MTEENKVENYIKSGIEDDDDAIDITMSESSEEKNTIEISKKPRKQQIIDDIKELSQKMGIPCDSDNKMNKARIVVLEKKLGELVNRSLTCDMNPKLIQQKELIAPVQEIKDDNNNDNTSRIPDDMAAEALYNINFLMVNTIENITNNFDLPISLDGLTKKMDETKKEELKAVLLKIVGNHGNVIKPFLSPIALYCYIMLTTVQQTVHENLKKRSTEQKDCT